MQNNQEINRLLEQGKIEQALHQINRRLEKDAGNDELLYLRGNAYFKSGNWQAAIENYLEAQAINADGPAAEALKMANNILNFYNKDIYCQ